MTLRLLILVLFLTGPLAVRAVLPRDAEFRKKEIFEYRQRKTAEYEKAHQQQEILMVSQDRLIRQELAVSPWARTVSSTAVVKTDRARSERQKAVSEQQHRKWILSAMALLFIGGCVWLVRTVTGNQQEQ